MSLLSGVLADTVASTMAEGLSSFQLLCGYCGSQCTLGRC